MERAGINPVQLEFEEGIALDNDTQLMTVIAALTVCDTENLLKTAEIATTYESEIDNEFQKRVEEIQCFAPRHHTTKYGDRLYGVVLSACPRICTSLFACSSDWPFSDCAIGFA